MAMFNYESDELYQQVKGEALPSSPVYVAECKKEIIDEASPNYPQLVEYEKEWLNFARHIYHDGTPVPLEYQEVKTDEYATVNNAIPFNYKSAILKGSTKYRDIDTGDILDTFDESKNLELVSVEMPVLTTTGKNLCDNLKNKLGEISTGGKEYNVSTGIISDYINFTYGEHYSGSVFQNGNRIGSTTYRYYDKNKTFLGTSPNENAKFVRLRYYKGSTITLDDYQFQYELGSGTSYEPFKSNILTVNEEVELRGVGDVHDELDLLTGELTQRINEVVLDGSEQWQSSSKEGYDIPMYYLRLDVPSNVAYNTKDLINNLFPVIGYAWRDEEHIWIDNSVGLLIHTNLYKTLNELKQSLSTNNLILQYPMNPTIKTVDLNTPIKPYEGTNHYTVSSDTIPPQLLLSLPVVSTGAKTLNDIITEE